MTFDLERLIVHAGGRPHSPRFERDDVIAFENLTGHQMRNDNGDGLNGRPFPARHVAALLWVMCGGLEETSMTLDAWEDEMTPADTGPASRMIERVIERDQLSVLRSVGILPRGRP